MIGTQKRRFLNISTSRAFTFIVFYGDRKTASIMPAAPQRKQPDTRE
jgi:hypothetical protein